MSMIAKFREITPRLLAEIARNPSLTETVIVGSFDRGESSGDSTLDSWLSAFPARQREQLKAEIMKAPPEVREHILGRIPESLERLRGVARATREAAGGASIDARDLGDELDIQKAWHGLHFLLTGTAEVTREPLGQVIFGGSEVGEDTGYGPPRCLEPSAVVAVAEALSKITRDQLRQRYDAVAMNAAELYPGGWEDPENESWLLDAFEDVAGFYQGVASRGNAVLLYLV